MKLDDLAVSLKDYELLNKLLNETEDLLAEKCEQCYALSKEVKTLKRQLAAFKKR